MVRTAVDPAAPPAPSPAPLPRHPHQHLVTGPLVPSRSAVLFPHLAALSARTPTLAKAALLSAAPKPLLTAAGGLKTPELAAAATASGMHSMPRISQPVVSLRSVVTHATTAGPATEVVTSTATAIAAAATAASRPAARAVSPSSGVVQQAQKSTNAAVHSSSVGGTGRATATSPLLLPAGVGGVPNMATGSGGGTPDQLSLPPITSAAIISTIVGTVVQESLERERRRSQEKEQQEEGVDEKDRRNKTESGRRR